MKVHACRQHKGALHLATLLGRAPTVTATLLRADCIRVTPSMHRSGPACHHIVPGQESAKTGQAGPVQQLLLRPQQA